MQDISVDFLKVGTGHSTHFQLGGDHPNVEGGILQNQWVCKTKPYFTFTLTFSFLKTKKPGKKFN